LREQPRDPTLLAKVAYKDYYSVLGVTKDASQDEINSAYRKLARKFHPDISKQSNAEERFKEVGTAYDVLRDEEKRKLYDLYGEQWKAVSEGRAPPPGAERARVDFQEQGFDPQEWGDLGSLFEQFFGGRGRTHPGGTQGQAWGGQTAGIDVEAKLDLSVEEAFRGGQRNLSLQDPSTGETRHYNVTIPAGVRSGQRIRLAGQGRAGAAEGKKGDLYLVVTIVSSNRFELDGSDVRTTLDLSPWDAALGCKAKVPILDGDVKVTIPAGSSSGREIRLSGKGYPKSDGSRGDLYAEIRIRVPAELNDEERRLFEQLRETSRFQARTEGAR
jgi:curved DNA-binding protein